MVKISFTWDDGALEDLKLIDFSLRYNIPGMFFIPAKNPERRVLPKDKIKFIIKAGFEIGAHTFSHVYLTSINPEAASQEIISGKIYLEQLTGKEISHFCFPGGKYDRHLVLEAKKHFVTARTAHTCSLPVQGSFLIKPSFHFFDRGKLSLVVNSIRNNISIFRSIVPFIGTADYFEILKSSIKVLAYSKEEHRLIVWGHSWEIEEFGLWKKLEELFFFLHKYYPNSLTEYSDMVKPV